jgi:hypothetical protein
MPKPELRPRIEILTPQSFALLFLQHGRDRKTGQILRKFTPHTDRAT